MSKKYRVLLVVAPAFLLVDQISKILVRHWLPQGDRIAIIPRFFNLVHVRNPGAAWGLMGEAENRLLIFLAVSVVAFVVIGMYVRALPATEGWLAAALAMILAGAAGNFIDRVVFHEVTDFLDFYVGWSGSLREFLLDKVHTTHYPTYNVADIAIVVGVGMFLVHVLIIEPRQARRARQSKDGVPERTAVRASGD